MRLGRHEPIRPAAAPARTVSWKYLETGLRGDRPKKGHSHSQEILQVCDKPPNPPTYPALNGLPLSPAQLKRARPVTVPSFFGSNRAYLTDTAAGSSTLASRRNFAAS